MKTNKQFIDEIYEKYDEYTNEKQYNKQKNLRKLTNVAATIIVLISSIIVFTENPTPQKIQENSANINDINLQTVGTFENFYNIIKSQKQEYGMHETMDLAESSNTLKAEVSADATTSKTNTQVENVDESDIVKVDNKYIYYVANQKIVIIDAQSPENANKIAEINYEEEDFKPRELYIRNNKLIVIGNETQYNTTKTRSMVTNDIAYPNSKLKTGIILYDITNITEPKEIRRVMVEGGYVSSRMIQDNIYFVANQYIYHSTIAVNEMKDLDQDEFKPKYEDTIISEEEKCIDYNRIYCFEETNNINYLMLVGLNIEKSEEAEIKTFLGAGEYVYSSEKNMYIAINRQKYGEGYELLGGTTHILKFALENGKIIFKAEADVEGQVNNQFSMDENGEYFRIATTTGRLWNMDENTSNNLYVLNENLEEVGKVTDFGKEEKIYSVRYVGDKAYVVTFKQTDPLFVIDLSNPASPQILGELKLPGYSTYLHPYDETHIIGFGYETKENGKQVTTDGLKMVMFDISDFTNPQVLFKVNIGNKYTTSELLYNHKALLYSKGKNIIGFPVRSYERGNANSRVEIYEINLGKGFVLKGKIIDKNNDYMSETERIVFVNNTYYTLSKKLVKAANMETFEIIKEIGL